jgi:predicted TIM-barrel fold metal-dependent hydrolase
MSIVVHAHANVNNGRPYGTREARIFLDSLLPEARDVAVQIAHLAGAGSYTDSTDHALAVYAEAIAKKDPRTVRLSFDVSGIGLSEIDSARKALIVARIRRIGLDRILFGSDAAVPGNSPREAWDRFRTLPLRDDELAQIAGNVAPYMK